MTKAKTTKKQPTARKKPPKNYHKYYLVLRNRRGKQIACNFGLKKYTEGKTVGKSFYLIFNPDGLSYTPAFIEENVGLKNTQQNYLKEHEKKIKRHQLKFNNNMKVPRPKGTAANYCAECKTKFQEDYFEHIASDGHKKTILEDQYQKRIQKLEKFYHNRKMRRWEKLKQPRQKEIQQKKEHSQSQNPK